MSVGEALELALEVDQHVARRRSRSRPRCTPTWPSATCARWRVTGLENTAYIDKVDGMTRKRQGAEPLRLTGETDRVFLGTRSRCVVEDRVLARRLLVDKTGSATTVVWNPWSTKAAGSPISSRTTGAAWCAWRPQTRPTTR